MTNKYPVPRNTRLPAGVHPTALRDGSKYEVGLTVYVQIGEQNPIPISMADITNAATNGLQLSLPPDTPVEFPSLETFINDAASSFNFTPPGDMGNIPVVGPLLKAIVTVDQFNLNTKTKELDLSVQVKSDPQNPVKLPPPFDFIKIPEVDVEVHTAKASA